MVPASNNCHYLLVDDHPANIFIISLILDDLGCSYDSVENGLDAVNKFQPGKYHAIFMDIDMPIMDGYSACKEIRHIEDELASIKTPIFIVTAKPMQDVEGNVANLTITHIFNKPIAYDDIVSKIKAIAA